MRGFGVGGLIGFMINSVRSLDLIIKANLCYKGNSKGCE